MLGLLKLFMYYEKQMGNWSNPQCFASAWHLTEIKSFRWPHVIETTAKQINNTSRGNFELDIRKFLVLLLVFADSEK